MAITAADVDNQSFSVDRKGYSIEEVDLFLEKVSREVDAMNKTISQLEQKGKDESGERYSVSQKEKDDLIAQINSKDAEINRLNNELIKKNDDGRAISEALIVAQRSADKIVSEANEKSDKIIKDANDRASFIEKDAKAAKKKVMNEIEKLEKQRSDARKEYKNMLRDIVSLMNKHLGELNTDGNSHVKKESKPQVKHSASPAVTAANKPVGMNGAAVPPQNQAAPKPQKDFSGFGDIDFGEDKID